MASSITIPTISVRASIVIWLSEYPNAAIAANDAMIETGIANAEMIVERMFHKKRKTMIAAKRPPSTKCSSMACKLFRMNSD